MSWLWWGLVALAQEVGTPPSGRVGEALLEVRHELRDQGFHRVLTLGPRSWWAKPDPFAPYVMVHEQGFARIRSLALVAWPTAHAGKGGVSASVTGFVNRGPKERARRRKVLEPLLPRLQAVQDARWASAKQGRLAEVWEEADGIWIGEGSDAERRQRLVRLWANTTDTDDGQAVREVVERFVAERVQPSAPFTAEELEHAVVHEQRLRVEWP